MISSQDPIEEAARAGFELIRYPSTLASSRAVAFPDLGAIAVRDDLDDETVAEVVGELLDRL